jgi:ABC-type branched-subunit amino acid transport system ATPase component
VIDNLVVAAEDPAQRLSASLLGRRVDRAVVERAGAILERIGLIDKMLDRPGSLSGGEVRLLEVGRHLMRDPRYLLLDEPTAGVSPQFQMRLAALISALRDEGKTLICVEHNMRFLTGLADRLVVLNAGQIIASGPAHEIFRDPTVVEAYLGTAARSADA